MLRPYGKTGQARFVFPSSVSFAQKNPHTRGNSAL